MILPDEFRRRAAGQLDARCMLRVCRDGGCLFVTDYPARCPENAGRARCALEADGWDVVPSGRLWRLDPGKEMWRAFIRCVPREELPDPLRVSLPLYSLAVRLTRTPSAAEDQPVAPLRLLIKAVDTGRADEVLRAFPPLLSALLREKKPLPEAAGWTLIWAMNRNIF